MARYMQQPSILDNMMNNLREIFSDCTADITTFAICSVIMFSMVVSAVLTLLIIYMFLQLAYNKYQGTSQESFEVSEVDLMYERAPLDQTHSTQFNPSKKSELITSSRNAINKIIRQDYSGMPAGTNIGSYDARIGWVTDHLMQRTTTDRLNEGRNKTPEVERLENIRLKRSVLNQGRRSENMEDVKSSSEWASGFGRRSDAVNL